ncbi:hypothetical protein [Lishizhenia sp.]|uniref:hypothetical protein n=1 Tax=Lishizhenia sp. TaxID=2497594 RepID=UPI00299D49D7|nr:hypothetical protein [Lishizhenia sp.]MDX1444781.1 hypothetical protein [Lishizhenia sp.]
MIRFILLLMSMCLFLLSCNKEDNQLTNNSFLKLQGNWQHLPVQNVGQTYDDHPSYDYLLSHDGQVYLSGTNDDITNLDEAFKVLNNAYLPDTIDADFDKLFINDLTYKSLIRGMHYFQNKIYVWGDLHYTTSNNTEASMLFTYNIEENKVEENHFFNNIDTRKVHKLMTYKGELIAFTENEQYQKKLICISCDGSTSLPDISSENFSDVFAVDDQLYAIGGNHKLVVFEEATSLWQLYTPNLNNYQTLYVFKYNNMTCALGNWANYSNHLIEITDSGTIAPIAINDDHFYSIPMNDYKIKVKVSEGRLFIFGDFSFKVGGTTNYDNYLLEYVGNKLVVIENNLAIPIKDVISVNGDILIINSHSVDNLWKYIGN